MAWSCSGSSMRQLLTNMRDHGLISSERVFAAMIAVDRADFAPSGPYLDRPQPIGILSELVQYTGSRAFTV